MNEEFDAVIPHKFTARDYQVPFLWEVQKAIEGKSKKRYFYQVWHRRSGKDKTNIADVAPRRLIIDPCLVKYVYPTLVMGRDNLWEGIGSDGLKYTDHIPETLRVGEANDTRMTIKVQNNTDVPSIFQIAGTNKPDTLRGGNPKLFIFSEWAEHDPYAWDVVEPILKENDGIAIFNTTPKGDNHARALLEYAKNNPLWHVDMLTAKDTGIWTEEELEDILKDIIKRFAANGRSESEAIAYFEQEYMCSFQHPVVGSYYGAAVQRAEKEGRITMVPVDESAFVDTSWDLGIDDSTTIWFFQRIGQQIRFVDYYENSGEGLGHYAHVMQERGYVYGRHFAPHDIAVRELGSGKSRLEVAKSLGIRFEQGPVLSLDDGINAVRSMFSQFWFDADKCHRGLNALKNYQKKWDEKNKVFMNNPLHNWASHGADALRTMAVGYKEQLAMPDLSETGYGGVKPYAGGIG